MNLDLAFVGSIAASPTVRLNLHGDQPWRTRVGTRFDPPPLRYATASTLLTDGERIQASAYANRVIPLRLRLEGNPTEDQAATYMQALLRELNRPTNILRYQPGTSLPVFFRTFRCAPDSVDFDPETKEVTANVPAEPFALGLKETLSPVTVNNNPAAGSNGMFFDVTGIKGDVDTPLFIEYTDGTAGPQRPGLAMGVRSGSPYPTLFRQAESFTTITDTSVVVDAAFSGGSKTRTTFAIVQDLVPRLVGNFPSATEPAGAENWGVFRVFARVAQTVAGDVMTMNIDVNDAVTLLSQTQAQMVDLGVADTRGGAPTTGGYAATPYRIEDQRAITVEAQRVSGSGSLDIDYLVFVPADQCYGAWGAHSGVTTTGSLVVLDGPNDDIYIATALAGATPGRVAASSHPARVGSLPVVRPGDNRVVVVQTFPASAVGPPTADALSTAFTVNVSYWPRYLYVRAT